MATREEIREELAENLCTHDAPYCYWKDIPDIGHPSMKDRKYYRRWADTILSNQHSQDVGIKGEEHPEYPGWFKFEPLIEVKE